MIDFTKPLRNRRDHSLTYQFIGWDGPLAVLKSEHNQRYFAVHQSGVGVINSLFEIENPPVTYKRWIIVWCASGQIRTSMLNHVPTETDVKLYNEVLAIKEVTIEEGEGCHA